ncbi:MAG: hypothetical protein ACYC1M_08275 [Armatimonadota bacterium]
MSTEQYEERITRLSARIDELEQQLAEQLITRDLQIIDQEDRVRIRMFCDDDHTAKVEAYKDTGSVGTRLSVTADGTSRFEAMSKYGESLDMSVVEGRLGTIRMVKPEMPDFCKHTEMIIGESEDMIVGIQVKIDMTEKIFIGVDKNGEAKIRLTQSDGTVNEITPSKP